MSRRKRYQPKPWETSVPNDGYVPIHWRLITSWAFQQLSDSAKVCYLYCRSMQHYGNNDLADGEFYFNRAVLRNLGWYKEQHKPIRCMRELVRYGFVDVVTSGKNTRTKSRYRYSSDWQRMSCLEDRNLNGPSRAYLGEEDP